VRAASPCAMPCDGVAFDASIGNLQYQGRSVSMLSSQHFARVEKCFSVPGLAMT
jgi:hypothetical protein